jgi:4-hydroxy-2-oxoheptanedioate aldolase
MTAVELCCALHSDRRVFGTLIVSDSPRWPNAVAAIGFDFVFIDTEHIAIDRKTLSWMCQTYNALGLPAIVRITAPDPYQACMVLDAGACGVVAPYVETVEEVEALRGAVKLRPIKGFRLKQLLGGVEPEPDLGSYLTKANAGNVLVINIESRPAIENLDRLLAVPGLDAVLIGPHDLSCSLGIPECYNDSRFDAAVTEIFQKARRRGIGAGIHSWMGAEREAAWASGPYGANLIIHESDMIAMGSKLAADLRVLRAHFDENGPPARSSLDIV